MPLPTRSLEPDGFGLPSAPPAFPAAPAPITPLVPAMPMPGMTPPSMPAFHPPSAQQQEPMQARLLQLLPILIGGLKKPEDIGAALRGLQEGRDRKLQQQEHAQQTNERRSKEAADFYGRAASDAMNFDDPALFERWRQSIAPLAQFYGIDANAFQFNQTKGTKAKQSKLVSALDAMEKRDPTLVNRDDFRITTPEYPEGVEAATVRTWRGQATDKSGKTILPAVKPDSLTPNTPEEQFYAQYATEHGAKSFAALSTKDQADARKQWQESGRSDAGGSDYARFLARFAKERNKTVEALTVAEEKEARKEFGQADDKAGTGPRDRFSVQQVTKPDGSIGLVRVNLDSGEVSPVELPAGSGAGKAGDTERLSKAYYDRSIASDKTALDFEKALTGLGAQIDVNLPNLLKSEQGQGYRQAKDEFINAALRRESGAAIQPSEYDRFDKIYFVKPGDTPATIKQKQEARRRVVEGFRVASGNLGAATSTSGVQKWGRDKNGHPVRLAQ